MKSALLLSLTEACSRAPQDDSVIQLTPSDCTGNSIWSDEERNCACAWGWSGNDCDEWGKRNTSFLSILTKLITIWSLISSESEITELVESIKNQLV